MTQAIVTLVIPSYNEEAAIPVVLEELARVKNGLPQYASLKDLEIIVVDDGSTDGSLALLEDYDWIRLLRHDCNKGYGAAIKTGMTAASGHLVAFMDMDATYSARDILSFSEKVVAFKVDMIVGERQIDRRSMPLDRRFGNFMFSSLVGLLHRVWVRDSCSGIRVLRREMMLKLLPHLPDQLDFALALTLAALAEKHPFLELPTGYRKRIGRSKLNEIVDGFRFLGCILNSRFRPQKRTSDADVVI